VALEVRVERTPGTFPEQVGEVLEASWEDSTGEFLVLFRRFLGEELRSGLVGWNPSPEALERYPQLGDVGSVVDRIVSCIFVEPQLGHIRIYLDGDVLLNVGIPPELVRGFEYGSSVLPTLRCWTQAVERTAERFPAARVLVDGLGARLGGS